MAQTNQATQQFVEVEAIKDGVAILQNGSLRQILMVGGINFDLKSEEEQNLIIAGYQNFLNALDFSVQIVIHSRRLNITDYLEKLKGRQNQETNELLKAQIEDYVEFVRSFVENNAIMDKTFFMTVPYDPVVLPQGVKLGWQRLIGKKPKAETAPAEQDLSANLLQLQQRVDQVIVGLNQIGLRAVPLNNEEAAELFYNLYNPEAFEKKGLTLTKSS